MERYGYELCIDGICKVNLFVFRLCRPASWFDHMRFDGYPTTYPVSTRPLQFWLVSDTHSRQNPQLDCGPESVGNKTCPLKACCSGAGYCGLTSDFCTTTVSYNLPWIEIGCLSFSLFLFFQGPNPWSVTVHVLRNPTPCLTNLNTA